ncbi:fatty acyl-CoA reductase 1-like [Thrips palmi]|uniref:Fatty acyl-CoA reductase n=1 Tax=Thrips palmi TaxID=161013 RepID=A0A6P8ZZY0_THRPL|nr:fatty acyl-CoA reductase 1-like [Thrips palmi]XP_034251031.1 fatty acyl-CoA reductase 1-like [Thrips palmi]
MSQPDAHATVSGAFDGKVLLLTGASGFVGKALLEKLLRTCPGIRKVYIIMRSKAGTPPAQRLHSMLREPLFDKLRAAGEGDRLDRVVTALDGDCASLELGLSPQDRDTLHAEVQVFVHTAASVRFDDPLQRAVLLNTRGAREAAKLALGMSRLQVMVHVSTTYCNTHQPVIEECVYAADADWRHVIRLAETETAQAVAAAVPMGYQPNTYTFSKALAEQVMLDHSDRLNIAIFRPAIVVGAVKEPMPGWTNNLNGPFALCVGITKGLVHTTLADKDAVIDIVPLEMVVNGIILAAREGALRATPSLRVYNCSAAHRKTLSVCDSIACALKSNEVAPHDRVLWHPFVVVTSSMAAFTALTCLLHFAPALLLDLGLRVAGRRTWLLRTYWKIYRATVSLRYFSLAHWVFQNDQYYSLLRDLRPEDAAAFKLDMSDIDETEYVHTHLQFLRRYILKENMDPKAAKKNQAIMFWLDRFTRVVLLYIAITIVFRVVYCFV